MVDQKNGKESSVDVPTSLKNISMADMKEKKRELQFLGELEKSQSRYAYMRIESRDTTTTVSDSTGYKSLQYKSLVTNTKRGAGGNHSLTDSSNPKKNETINEHIRIHELRLGKHDKVSLYIPRQLIAAARQLSINFSSALREILLEKIRQRDPDFMLSCIDRFTGAEFLLVARCKYCGQKQRTTTVGAVNCENCKKQFRVLTPKQNNIFKIVRGTMGDVHKMYEKTYRKRS
jgi:hypothetical protein